jgi:serine/threonine protein kinase
MNEMIVRILTAANVEGTGAIEIECPVNANIQTICEIACRILAIPLPLNPRVQLISSHGPVKLLDSNFRISDESLCPGDKLVVLDSVDQRHISCLPSMPPSPADMATFAVSWADFTEPLYIARGSSGKVYWCKDTRTNGIVAVKAIIATQFNLIEFDRETTIMARFEHPTLLRLLGFCSSEEDPRIVTEYMPNGTVYSMIGKDKSKNVPPQWDDTQKFIVIYGVAVGMMILHSRQVIHRDLKPLNILLNEAFEPVIADFGFSKFIDAGQSHDPHSICTGTYEFMAPELFTSMASRKYVYGFAVDVFAYAMVVYNIFAKERPFPHLDIGYLIGQAILNGGRPNLGCLHPFIQELVSHCWQDSPAARPAFDQIVVELHLADLESLNVDTTRFEDYRRKVFPESLQIPNPISADLANLRRSAESGNAADANRLGCYYRDGVNVS